jgi:subtilisin family serine protease
VIGASANNALGIVGIAPEASLELFVSCWSEYGSDSAVCDSFTLAKALDALLEDPPDVLNLSLNGPDDALIKRLIEKTVDAGVIVVAAGAASSNSSNHFPANLDQVIGVSTSEQHLLASNMTIPHSKDLQDIYAPGFQIMVAVPNNAYDFRSGSSMAAAHVSGVIALMLANSPDMPFDSVLEILQASQAAAKFDSTSVNACVALSLADVATDCM